MTKLCLPLIAAALAACSTVPAPGVCCVGPEDCDRLGLSEDRPCQAEQACVDLQCVAATCSNLGCPAEAPVCDLTTDACRGCRLDTECPSGACGDDGACLAETAIVYLSPEGQNVPPCSRAEPCSDVEFAIRQTSDARNHLVMALGTYTTGPIEIRPRSTLASRVFIHGGGAKIMTSMGTEILFQIDIETMIRDLEIDARATAINAIALTSLERVRISATTGIIATHLKMHNVSILIRSQQAAILVTGTLDLDQVVIAGGGKGIDVDYPSTINISNLLVYGTSDIALDLEGSSGSVSFSTIAYTGASSTTATGISCLSQGPIIRSSIIWTPLSSKPPITRQDCNLTSVIAGPIGVVGAMNVNPLFMNPPVQDYHLSHNSPARDMVDSGPMFDFEGEARPRGIRFDLGADEAP